MNHQKSILAFLGFSVTLLILAACDFATETPAARSSEGLLLRMSTQTLWPGCDGCADATLAALQTQEQSGADAQAAATAAIVRANAQATLIAVNATVGAAQTQEKNNSNRIMAQIEATAAIIRANAQATLVAAGSTQSAALTQDAIRQTQEQDSLRVTAEVATQNAISTANQQRSNFLADSTQTAVSDLIATQTQSAVETSQWYADQERQRAEQRRVPLNFLWMWCPPFFIIGILLICLLFFWRWMQIRETQQLIDMQPVVPVIIEHELRQSIDVPNTEYPPIPTDHVHSWLEETKRKLITEQKDDDNDNPDS